MRNTKFGDRSIKQYLLFQFLPLLVSLVGIVSAWSIATAWSDASRRGVSFVSGFAHYFESELSEIQEELQLAEKTAIHAIEHNKTPILPADYTLLKIRDKKLVAIPVGKEKIPLEAVKETELAVQKIKRQGLYEIAGNFIYARQFGANPATKESYILLKFLSDSFANRIAQVIDAEVSFYVLKPEPKVAATSWKNIRQEIVVQEIPKQRWAQFAKLRPGEVLTGRTTLHIPEYQGVPPDLTRKSYLNRNENNIGVFYSVTPISDENKTIVGYFAVGVPEDLVLSGVKQNIWLLSLVDLFTILVGTFVIISFSKSFAKPLTDYADEINQIAPSLYSRTASFGNDGEIALPLKPSNELESLAVSIELLKQQVGRSEKIGKIIDDERARSQFSAKMAVLGEISANVAHEINNPISVIHALSDELQEKAQKGELNLDYVERKAIVIKRTATRVSGIVRALLRLSRDGKQDLMELHSVRNIVEDATVLVHDQMLKEGIVFSVHGLDEDVRICCRGAQISQVILNLLSNAIDAVSEVEQKIVILEIKINQQFVLISVLDSGLGVPDKIRSKVMQPFVTSKPPGKGTGLGLSISKHIIHEHEGELIFDETHPMTKFSIALPLYQNRKVMHPLENRFQANRSLEQ